MNATYNRNICFIVVGLVILFCFIGIVKADDNFYSISSNTLISNDFKVTLDGVIKSDVLIDENYAYVYTDKIFYFINKTTGEFAHTYYISGIKAQAQTNNYTYVQNSNAIYKINKSDGVVEDKKIYLYFLEKIYTFFGVSGISGIGEKGDKGDKGDTGEPGLNGTNGLPGAKGDKGDPGINGSDAVLGNISIFNISIPTLGNATATDDMDDSIMDFDDAYNYFWSTGVIEGGVATHNTTTVFITAGTAMLRTTDFAYGSLVAVGFNATNISSLSIGDVEYIYLDYNGGNPIISTTTNFAVITGQTKVTLYEVTKEPEGDYHFIDARGQNVDMGLKIRRYLYATERFKYANGAMISTTGTSLNITSGLFYYGLNPMTTSPHSHFEQYTHNATNYWSEYETSLINLTHYNPAGSSPVVMGANKYRTSWVFLELARTGTGDDELSVVLGQNQWNTLLAAQNEAVPTNLPQPIIDMGVLVGRVIVQKGTVVQVDSAFKQTYALSAATDHTQLTNLQGGIASEYYHLTAAEILRIQYPTKKLTVGVDNRAGNAVIPTGYIQAYLLPFNATITAAEMFSDVATNANVSIWMGSTYPPNATQSIVDGNYLTLTGQTYSTNTLVGWTTAVTTNKYLYFNTNSVSASQKLDIVLTLRVTP